MHQPPKPIKLFSWFLFLVLTLSSLSVNAATLREMYESALDAYNKGQYDQAIEIYKQINKEVPQFVPAYIGIGLSLKEKGAEFEEILYYYKLAVEKDPTNAQAYDQLGRLYYSAGKIEKAMGAYEKALRINPNMPEVKLSLGWIYLTGKRINPQRAVLYFQDCIKSIPSPNAYLGLGMAYFADNQRGKVLDVITQLKMMGSDDMANKLEKAVRENRRIVLNDPEESSEGAEDKNTFQNTPDTPKGVKVRLSGKLDAL